MDLDYGDAVAFLINKPWQVGVNMTEESKNLKRIRVEGFKSIKELDLPMKDINILIGANGAGKTNLVSLFTFLGRLSQGKLQQYIKIEGGAERFFHFGARNTERIKLGLEIGNNEYNVEFLPDLDNDSLSFDIESCRRVRPSGGTHWHLRSRRGESGFATEDLMDQPVKYFTKKYLDQCRVYHFHDTSGQAGFKKRSSLDNYYYLEEDAANIAPFLYNLKTDRDDDSRQSYRQIVCAIQSVAPFFHDFYLEPAGKLGDENILLRWMHTDHLSPFSANVLSDGTARFACLATLLLQPESRRPSTIILDEPELGLHPAALCVLADIIRSISVETQVICSTQSVVFANFFSPEDFIVTELKNGVSVFERLEREQVERWLDEYGMGDIWSKNLIGGRPEW